MKQNPIEFARSLRQRAAQLEAKAKEILKMATQIEANASLLSDVDERDDKSPSPPVGGEPPTLERIRARLEERGGRVNDLAAYFGCSPTAILTIVEKNPKVLKIPDWRGWVKLVEPQRPGSHKP